MAEMRASPVKIPGLKTLADIVRMVEERGQMEILPFNPAALFPVSSTTLENLAYGNLPMAIPSQSNIPITKTGRKQEVAELAGLLPTLPAASRGVTQGANYLGDVMTQAVTRNPQATSMRALEEIGRMSPVPQITTYHGSPYLFSKFDPARVGTGEGAQAYGVGAGYTAEARPVAEGYRQAISKDKFLTQEGIFEPSSLEHLNVKATLRKDGLEKAIEVARKSAVPDEDYPEVAAKAARDLQVLERLKESGGIQPIPGYLYKGEIPDEILPRFLDLDKPINKQPNVMDALRSEAEQRVRGQKLIELENEIRESIQSKNMGDDFLAMFEESNIAENQEIQRKALERLNEMDLSSLVDKEMDALKPKDMNWNMTGKEFYEYLARTQGSADQASALLQRQGLRGIRYLDQDSRTGGKNTSNFIPFSPEDYQIQEINDQPIADFVRSGHLQVAPDDPLAQFLSGR